jgi:predicted flap endonuclease-1-like 5' DNA nuclease
MRSIFDAYTVPIIIALVIGLLIGWWLFSKRGGKAAAGSETREPVAPPAAALSEENARPVSPHADGAEGNGLADQGAAAASDVYGEVLGVQAHAEIPGADGPPDALDTMKGVGPKFVARLHENGITRFEQLARLSDNEVALLDDRMGPFKGRLRRDRVVEQAAYLARGDRDGFEATFGKLGSAS